jgi:hypothetical protein
MDGNLFAGIIAVSIIICVIVVYHLMSSEQLPKHDLITLPSQDARSQLRKNRAKRERKRKLNKRKGK